jgi:hypothetical protein
MGRYSSIVAALTARLNAHRVEDGLLAGFNYQETPVKDVEGQSDLPMIRQFIPSIGEKLHSNKIVDGSFDLNLTLSTDRADGLAAHLGKLERLMDAIETDPDDGLDDCLGKTTIKPITFSVKEPFMSELSITSQLTISAQPKLCSRGNRRG